MGSPGLSRCAQCDHKGPDTGNREAEEGDQRDGFVRRTQSAIAGFEDGGRGHMPRNVGGL